MTLGVAGSLCNGATSKGRIFSFAVGGRDKTRVRLLGCNTALGGVSIPSEGKSFTSMLINFSAVRNRLDYASSRNHAIKEITGQVSKGNVAVSNGGCQVAGGVSNGFALRNGRRCRGTI